MAIRPILGLAVASDPPVSLVRLLVEMRLWCTPRAAERDLAAAAWLASSPDAPDIERAVQSRSPLAVWLDDPALAERVEAYSPVLVLTANPEISTSMGATLVSSDPEAPADRVVVVPPFVRERLRRRAGLPAVMVARVTSAAVPDGLVPAALAVCSACIVTGGRLAEALAWGAPSVTDPASAAAVGASNDQEVLVGTPAEHALMAERLARDAMLAARLSHAARRLAEAHSVKRVAAEVAVRLGLVRAATAPVGPRLEAVLRLLAYPASPLQPEAALLLAMMEAGDRAVAAEDPP